MNNIENIRNNSKKNNRHFFNAVLYFKKNAGSFAIEYNYTNRSDLQKEIDARISEGGFRAYYVLEMKNIGVLYSI